MNKDLTIIFTIICLILHTLVVDAQTGRPSDDVIIEKSRTIRFHLNKAALSQKDLLWINDTLKDELEKSELSSLYIRVAASPDGPYDNNVTLSRNRYNAIKDFLKEYGIDESDVVLEIIPEDYYLLRVMLVRANDPWLAEYDSIYHSYTDEVKRKSALMKYKDGKMWHDFIERYYPNLRAVRMVIFNKIPENDTIELKSIDTPLPQLQIAGLKYEPMSRLHGLFMSYDTIVKPRREILSVKTNLLYDFAYMPGYDRWCPIPNVAIEYYPLHGHFTFGASIDFPWWQHYWQNKYFQIRNYQLETRYYLRSGDIDKVGLGNGAAFKGLYANAYVHGGLFSICFDANHGWEGEGIGAGVGLGYVLPLSRDEHWRLEFAAQVGFFTCKHDPYQFECPVDPTEQDHLYYYKWTGDADLFRRRKYTWSWIGPTKIGITLSYDLFYRKNHKHGISFRDWERVQEGGEL